MKDQKEININEAVREALGNLEVPDDSNWNEDGTPNLEAVQVMLSAAGVELEVTRQHILDAAPRFTRETGDLTVPEPAKPVVTESGLPDEEGEPTSDEIEAEASADHEERIASLREELTDITAERDENLRSMEVLRKDNLALEARTREINTKLAELSPPPNASTVYKSHLDTQQRLKQERVEDAKKIRQALGLDTGGAGAAPIDASRARRSGYGRERKVRGPITAGG